MTTKMGAAHAAGVVAGTLMLVATFQTKDDKTGTISEAKLEFPALAGKGPQEIDLRAEGPIVFVDLTVKDQAERAEKLKETREKNPTLSIANAVFYSETHKKYAAILRCVGVGGKNTCPTNAVVRKWTSDLHQSHRCDACGVKAKRMKSKGKRSAKGSAVPGALPVQVTPTPDMLPVTV